MERLHIQGIGPFEHLFRRSRVILGSSQPHDTGVDSMLFSLTMPFPAYEHSAPEALAFVSWGFPFAHPEPEQWPPRGR